MSFNLRYDNPNDGIHQWSNRKEACVTMLNTYKPSIIGTQEGLKHQIDYLNNQLYDYHYVGNGREDGQFKGEYAAIFYLTSQFKLQEEGMFWLSKTPNYPSIGWDAALERIVTWVKLKNIQSDKTVYVFNTHFDHEGSIAREESAKLLVKQIEELTEITDEIYITGDFNGIISQDMFIPIKAKFLDAQKDGLITDHTGSFNAFGSLAGILGLNIDFIFYKNSTAISYQTITKDFGVPYISDHYPILGTFKTEL